MDKETIQIVPRFAKLLLVDVHCCNHFIRSSQAMPVETLDGIISTAAFTRLGGICILFKIVKAVNSIVLVRIAISIDNRPNKFQVKRLVHYCQNIHQKLAEKSIPQRVTYVKFRSFKRTEFFISKKFNKKFMWKCKRNQKRKLITILQPSNCVNSMVDDSTAKISCTSNSLSASVSSRGIGTEFTR